MYVNKFGYKLNYSLEFIGFEIQEKYSTTFKNGYSVSIIRSLYSYGGDENLYEMAILNKDDEIVYENDFAIDTLGFLNENEVRHYLKAVEHY